MDIHFLFRGLIIGLSIAAPVGPIGILCIRRSIASGRLSGFISGLGAATADAAYGSVAAFGLTAISSFLVNQQSWLRLIGGLFLCFLGVKTLLSHPIATASQVGNQSLLGSYSSTLLLTLTNPLTILSFAAIFAGLGLVNTGNSYISAGLTVLGVFLGSTIWWFFLSWVSGLLRDQLKVSGFLWVNRLSGLVILGFGVAALIGAFL